MLDPYVRKNLTFVADQEDVDYFTVWTRYEFDVDYQSTRCLWNLQIPTVLSATRSLFDQWKYSSVNSSFQA